RGVEAKAIHVSQYDRPHSNTYDRLPATSFDKLAAVPLLKAAIKFLLLQITIEPLQSARQAVFAVARLPQPVAFAGVTHENASDAAHPHRRVHLFGLRDVNVVVLFAVE